MLHVRAYLQDILLLRHVFFGLPYLFVATILAYLSSGASFSFTSFILLIAAFFTLRTAGMSLNRLIDCEIDAENPRTATRALPIGLLSRREVTIISLLSFGLYFFFCRLLNETTFFLSFIPAILVGVYSFTKRFTAMCHFVLGLVHFCIPILVYAALTSKFALAPFILGTAELCIIAAGDMFYACEDIEFDKSYGLYSIPARYGRSFALLLGRFLQLVAIGMFILLGIVSSLSFIYYLGVLSACLMYGIQATRKRSEFMINNRVSLVIFMACIGELVWQRLC